MKQHSVRGVGSVRPDAGLNCDNKALTTTANAYQLAKFVADGA
jgi:hypothetical protein